MRMARSSAALKLDGGIVRGDLRGSNELDVMLLTFLAPLAVRGRREQCMPARARTARRRQVSARRPDLPARGREAGTRRSARHPRRLGPRAAGPGERGRARGHARLRPPLGRVSAHDARGIRRGSRPAAGPDGKLRGRAPDDRIGSHPLPDLMRVNKSIEEVVLREPGARRRLRARRERPSLGLVSYGGVHSHIDHLRALLELARRQGWKRDVHPRLTDGRDVSPHSATATCPSSWRKELESCPFPAGTTRWTAMLLGAHAGGGGGDHGAKRSQS